jgi:hypothetical protein
MMFGQIPWLTLLHFKLLKEKAPSRAKVANAQALLKQIPRAVQGSRMHFLGKWLQVLVGGTGQ